MNLKQGKKHERLGGELELRLVSRTETPELYNTKYPYRKAAAIRDRILQPRRKLEILHRAVKWEAEPEKPVVAGRVKDNNGC